MAVAPRTQAGHSRLTNAVGARVPGSPVRVPVYRRLGCPRKPGSTSLTYPRPEQNFLTTNTAIPSPTDCVSISGDSRVTDPRLHAKSKNDTYS
jgi:hypothetical protein